MTARERVAAHLDQYLNHQRGLDKDVIHNMNGCELLTADIAELLRLSEPGPDSYVLRDREGDWWVYAPEGRCWVVVGRRLDASAADQLKLYTGNGMTFVNDDPVVEAERVIENYGVWA